MPNDGRQITEETDVLQLTQDLARNKIDRRAFLKAMGALGVSLGVSLQLADHPAAAAVEGAARRAARNAPSVTLTYWRHFFAPELTIEQERAKQFQALHPNVKVNVVDEGSTATENEKVLVAFAGGGAPDLLLAYSGYWPEYTAFDFFQPIDYDALGTTESAYKKKWLPGALETYSYRGQYYGIPDNESSYVMVISPPLFRAAGLDPVKDAPKTWEDIATIGPKLTKVSRGAIVQQGFGIPSYPSVFALLFVGMVHQLGDTVVAANGKTGRLTSPASVKALQTFYDYQNVNKISALATTPLQGPGFATGSTAIIADVGIWFRSSMQDSDPKIYDKGKGIKFLPWPRFAGGKNIGAPTYGYGWCVNRRSPNAEWAWKFADFMSSRSSAYIPLGDVPPQAAFAHNPAVTSNPDVRLAFGELASGAPPGNIPDQVSTIIYAAATSSLLDKVPVATALAQANDQLNSLLPTLAYKVAI